MAVRPDQLEFSILLALDGETRFAHIVAETRHLAVRAAEARHFGFSAVEVLATHRVAGRCTFCGAVLFEDDHPRSRGNGVRCRDC